MKPVLTGQTLLFATHNKGKLAEASRFLAPQGIKVQSAADINLLEPEETEDSFHGNARLKAAAACKTSGLPALADDSGLCVDALDGAPGIHSARWAGENRDFSHAMKILLSKLENRPDPASRRAEFVSVLCLCLPDGSEHYFEGYVKGIITSQAYGTGGFGYDPVFIPDGETRTFGQMSADEKARYSHRAEAFSNFLGWLSA